VWGLRGRWNRWGLERGGRRGGGSPEKELENVKLVTRGRFRVSSATSCEWVLMTLRRGVWKSIHIIEKKIRGHKGGWRGGGKGSGQGRLGFRTE